MTTVSVGGPLFVALIIYLASDVADNGGTNANGRGNSKDIVISTYRSNRQTDGQMGDGRDGLHSELDRVIFFES